MRLFLLEKRLWKVLVVLSNSIWTDSKMFSMKAKGLISQLRKFFVSLACLLIGQLLSVGRWRWI